MSLDILPEELLVIIIKQLDLKAVVNLFKAGNTFIKTVICCKGVIKKCDFTLNSMATVHSLKTDFFRSISTNLQELSLCGVPDLNKLSLLQAASKLKNLVTLDVSYTSIGIFHLLDVYVKCPTIKNISIDFQICMSSLKKAFTQDLLIRCQDVFANFKNVTFVGSLDNLLYSKLPHLILEKAALDTLIYTISKLDKMFSYYKYVDCKSPSCNKFFVNIMYWKCGFRSQDKIRTMDIYEQVNFDYEYILITEEGINCSEVFIPFLDQKFKNKKHNGKKMRVLPFFWNSISQDLPEPPFTHIWSSSVFMMWRKETTDFNESFFSDLYTQLKDHFPDVKSYSEEDIPETVTSDWVWIAHPPVERRRNSDDESSFKRRRLAVPSVNLNYDRYFENVDRAKLSIKFFDQWCNPFIISPESNFLKKLTFLSLSGHVRYSVEFFNVLFRQCENLLTLNVDSLSSTTCIPSISRSIPLSRTLKNLRIEDKGIDCGQLFPSLAQCRTLENIYLFDRSKQPLQVFNPDTVFQQCEHLYYLCIVANFSDTTKKRIMNMLNKSKQKFGLNALNIELFSDYICHNLYCEIASPYAYDPYIEVFRICPIKAVR